jgi:hypothetical protein
MNQLAEELKEIVGNYTDNFKIEIDEEYIDLIVDDITNNLMNEIVILSKSLDYGFIIKQPLGYGVKIEFYKTL